MLSPHLRRPLASFTIAATLSLVLPAGLAAAPPASEGRKAATTSAVRALLSPWSLLLSFFGKEVAPATTSDPQPGGETGKNPPGMGVRIDPDGGR